MGVSAWPRDHKIALAGVLVGAAGVAVAVVAVVASVVFTPQNSDSAAPKATVVLLTPTSAPGPAALASSPVPAPTTGAPPSKPVEYSYYPTRPTFRCVGDNCAVAPDVTINSATNNPSVGDERPFLAGSIDGAPVRNRLAVKPGDIVTVRAYVNNDADSRKLGRAGSLAQNLRVHVVVPTATQEFFNLAGFIGTDNGNPARINDTMLLVGRQTLTLAYVPGSARFTHIAEGRQLVDPVSDAIITSQGVGFGNLPSGLENAFFITLQVRIAAA